jgi:hypothetical protein
MTCYVNPNIYCIKVWSLEGEFKETNKSHGRVCKNYYGCRLAAKEVTELNMGRYSRRGKVRD